MELEGMLEEEGGREAVDEREAAVEELEPGFTLVNDFSAFKPVSQAAAEQIERGKTIAAEGGVEAVVRVTGESVIGKMQFDCVGEGAESYHVATAETVGDAEELLVEFAG